jgi:sugar phosphate isomerase/epimerase
MSILGLACSTLSCDGFGDNDFMKSFEVLPQIGFRYVEFNCWHPADLAPVRVRSIQERSEQTGLTPVAIYGSSFGGENNHALSKDVCHKLRMIEVARQLGCRRIVATGAGRGQQGGIDAILTVLHEIVPLAEETGVLICLENHANNNLETIEDYQRIFDAIDSPNVGICVDTGHFDAAAVDLDQVVEIFSEKINHIHVKEAIARGVEQFVRFGEGITDNGRLIGQLLARGYEGYVSVELALKDKSTLVHDLETPFKMFNTYVAPQN